MVKLQPLALLWRVALVGALLSPLASCKTTAQKAADLVEQGLKQEQANATDDAAETYRAALKLDPESTEARRALARLFLKLDNPDGARAQYTSLRERLPEDAEANLALAEIAMANQDPDRAASYLATPIATAKDDPRLKALQVALAFHRAEAAGDDAGRAAAVTAARNLLQTVPGAFVARRIVIQSLMNGPDPEAALPEIEAALREAPRSLELQMMKLNILSRRKDSAAGAEQLKAMYREFPDNPDVQTWLGEWYMAAGQPAETIGFLRDLAARRGDDPVEHDRIADYVSSHFPPREAQAELERIAADSKSGVVADGYRARAAAMRFALGDKEAALKAMRDLVHHGKPLGTSPRHRTMLAGMEADFGQRKDAERIVESVLASDPTFAPAQKLKASWMVADKDYSGAIGALRVALTATPRDPSLLTMLGQAYEASGSDDLAGDAFADAVEASDGGVNETVLFVRFLLRRGNHRVAEAVLGKGLDTHPDDPDLLAVAREAGITVAPATGN